MSRPLTNPPQMSVRAVVLAILLAMLLGAGNAYIGLFAGLTIASAIPAAVISMAGLRMLDQSEGVCRRKQHTGRERERCLFRLLELRGASLILAVEMRLAVNIVFGFAVA